MGHMSNPKWRAEIKPVAQKYIYHDPERSTHDPAGNRGFCGHTQFWWTSSVFVGTHAACGRTKIELD